MRLVVALPEGEYLSRSVRLPDQPEWEARYFKLKANGETWWQHERLGPPPQNLSVFERTNLWMINTARIESPPAPLYAALVWDEKPTGDGPGGTSHFAQRITRLGGRLAIINPAKL